MASFNYDRDDRNALIQFRDRKRQRRSIRLHNVSKTFAERFHSTVERLNEARCSNGTVDNHTTEFLRTLGYVYFDKLVKVELIEPRLPDPEESSEEDSPSAMLGQYLADYLMKRTDLKPATMLNYRQIEANLTDYFTPKKPIEDITEGDVVDFGRWMNRKKYARTTIDRRLSSCRTIFTDAVRHQLISANPFDGFRKPLRGLVSRNNRQRKHLVSAEDILLVIERAPDAEWRCLIALSRFGGLRVPSEALSLRWTDIDWNRNLIRVPCPKLEHLEGHEVREIPIFGELRPYLLECFECADAGSEFVITRNRPSVLKSGAGWANANMRTRLMKIIRSAGLKPWPRLWHNLRASRQTELADQFPSHVVCRWIGNSEVVAREHYLSVTPEHIERAISGSALPQTLPLDAVSTRKASQAENEQLPQLVTAHKETAARGNVRPLTMVEGGVEPPTCGL